jgi:hypothetical protein
MSADWWTCWYSQHIFKKCGQQKDICLTSFSAFVTGNVTNIVSSSFFIPISWFSLPEDVRYVSLSESGSDLMKSLMCCKIRMQVWIMTAMTNLTATQKCMKTSLTSDSLFLKFNTGDKEESCLISVAPSTPPTFNDDMGGSICVSCSTFNKTWHCKIYNSCLLWAVVHNSLKF